jgi:DedD protein
MAIFKFRKGGDDAVSAAAPLESVDAMRRRALHRLIGAAVLVVAGVIGFPMLFDNQPRPIAVDIPIEIPDKTKSRPIVLPAAPSVAEAAPPIAVAPTPAATPAAATAPKEPPVEAKPVEKSVEKATVPPIKKSSEPAKPVAPPAVAATPKPAPQPSSASDAAKAQALLEGKPMPPDASGAPTEGRFVVQVGAFADAAKAKEARTKLERAGLKTYTQVVETKDGQRTRVRVGPFGDKAQAESSASKIKALDLPASILVL